MPAQERWLCIAPLRDLMATGRLRVRPEGMDLFVVMCEGDVYVCDNRCAHQHFALLHTGLLRECLVTCPMHGWTYDVRTGFSATGEGRIATYPVSIRDDHIYIAVP